MIYINESTHDCFVVYFLTSSMGDDRRWMYDGWCKTGAHSREWVNKTEGFVDRAFSLSNNGTVRCPCSRCQNLKSQDKRQVSLDLCRNSFMPSYEVWVHHGEQRHQNASVVEEDDMTDCDRMDGIAWLIN